MHGPFLTPPDILKSTLQRHGGPNVAPVRHERGIDLRKGKTPSFECGRRTPIISQSDPRIAKLQAPFGEGEDLPHERGAGIFDLGKCGCR